MSEQLHHLGPVPRALGGVEEQAEPLEEGGDEVKGRDGLPLRGRDTRRRRGGPTKVVHVRNDPEALTTELRDDGTAHLGPRAGGDPQAKGHGDWDEDAAQCAEGQVRAVRGADRQVVVRVSDIPGEERVARA